MPRTKDILLGNDAGGSRAAVTKGHLEVLPIPFPGQELLDVFDHQTSPLFHRINANLVEARTLAALRDLLLPKLMSGEIRVKDAEKAVGEAA